MDPTSSAAPPHDQTPRLMPLWKRVLGFSTLVDRQTYFMVGVALMFLKYAGDAAIMFQVNGTLWKPWSYLASFYEVQQVAIHHPGLAYGLVAWSLPFMWVGASMSVRRALHAGFSAGVGLLFLVPIINWVVMVLLATAHGAAAPSWSAAAPIPGDVPSNRARAALLGAALGAAAALLMVCCSVYLLGGYGAQLFMAAPLIQGVLAGFFYNRPTRRSVRETVLLGTVTMLVAAGGMLLLALEGLICVLLAVPLAWIPVVLGALLGRSLAGVRDSGSGVAPLVALVLLFPLMTGMEAQWPAEHERAQTTTVDVDAPQEAVWNAVINFGELPEPTEWFFRLGIAYPLRAHMEGAGPTAVRHCEFTTGPFIEPITVWNPPHELAFRVESQPHAMKEITPYPGVEPPHFDGYIASKRGQFLLESLPGGRTRLSGTTWFVSRMAPEMYWGSLAGAAIHAVHQRVLDHVKARAEQMHRAGRP